MAVPDRRRTPAPRRDLNAGGRRITDLKTHPHPWITLEHLAAHLDFDRRTVLKWIRAGVLEAHQIEGCWRIETAVAVAFVEASRFTPTVTPVKPRAQVGPQPTRSPHQSS